MSPRTSTNGQRPSSPTILHSTDATRALLRGSKLMTRALCSTLGPHGSTVLSTPLGGGGGPEVISRAGILARRLIEVEDPFENMGALLIRHAACRVDRETGDGVATTAAVLDALLSVTGRLVMAGHSAKAVAATLVTASEAVLRGLESLRMDVDETTAAHALVAELLTEKGLATAVCDVVEAVGEDGFVDLRQSRRNEVEIELVEGTRWPGTVQFGATEAGTEVTEIADGRVLVCSDPLDSAAELLPLVQALMEQGLSKLVVIAPAVGPEVRSLVGANAGCSSFPCIIAVSLHVNAESDELLEDLAAYCGTRVVSRVAGQTLSAVRLSDLGAVRRAWFSNDELGLVAAGAPDMSRDRSRLLRAQLALCTDDARSAALSERIARLDGRTAVLAIPGLLGAQREELMSRVHAAVRVAQVVLRDGVTAGGGAALVQAAARAERAGELSDPVGKALLSAVAEPLRRIASSAGLEPSTVVERTRTAVPGTRLDVKRGCWLGAEDVDRLLDSVAVLRCALEVAVSTASTMLTAATLVRSPKPQISLEP